MDKKRLILWMVVILTLAFIFGQSLLNQEVSNKESEAMKEKIVQSVHEAVTGKQTLFYNVRDIAHIVEFAVLGLELVLLLRDKKKILRWLRAISYCVLVAWVDESIQYFSGRVPQIVDIWYDILDAVFGVIIGLMIDCFLSHKAKHCLLKNSKKIHEFVDSI